MKLQLLNVLNIYKKNKQALKIVLCKFELEMWHFN